MTEANQPKYSCIFTKERGETLCFTIDCPKMENLADILKIQLESRVIIPEDWTLIRLERFMWVDQTQPADIIDKHFRDEE